MKKDIVHTRVVSTLLIVVCIIVSAGLSGYFLDLYKTGVVSANEPPMANIGGGTISSYPTVPIIFDGSLSEDPDGEIFAYEWDFGDGYTGIGMKPTHSYEIPGTYTAVLKVTDNDGASDTESVDVSISEDTEGTGMYTLVTVNELLTNSTAWSGKLVRVAYATVTDAGSFDSGYGSDPSGWVKFAISDSSTTREIDVYCQGDADRPLELSQGDLVNVSALLEEYNNNWELNVRVDTLDRVKMCPAIYSLRTLGELFSDRMAHNGELVRVEDLKIQTSWLYGWAATDGTTTDSVDIYEQMGANVSQFVNVSDIVTVQGVFTYYDYDQDGPDDDEWEIKVRATAEDMVLRTWEFDYSPAIGAVKISPLAPSPFTAVKVNATVTDNIQVASVSLFYSFNAGAQIQVAMARTVGSFYGATIPAAPHLTNVSYFVRAADNKGQTSNSSVQNYTSIDSPPTIVEFGHAPAWVRPGVNMTVWAVLEDDGGIASAKVAYSNDSWATVHIAILHDDGIAPDNAVGDGAFNVTIGSFGESAIEYFVFVNDTVGQDAVSENATFISSFDQLPVIGGVYRDIELPKSTESVKVIANVTDDFLLTGVTLVYNNGSGNVEVNMTLKPNGNYEGIIPPQKEFATISYYVNATDNASHTVKSPSQPATYFVNYGVPAVLYATGHGEYKGGMDEYFAPIVTSRGFYYLEADMNDVDLSWVEFVIISDPDSQYTAAELSKLKTFVEGGGGLLVLGSSDYGEGGRPENCNPILQYLGIEGRINDDGLEDEFNAWDYPTFADSGGSGPYTYLPYFNYYHLYPNASAGWNPPYDAGEYDNWWCFENDTSGITFDFTAQKKWVKSTSVCTLYNISKDIKVVQGTEYGYNKDNDIGGDDINEAYFFNYPVGGKTFPPVMAANTSIGTGRVLYSGFGRTLGDSNYYGWTQSNLTEFSENIITWLVNQSLLEQHPRPGISNVTATPESPTSSQDVTVSATVTGIGPAISRVVLRYSVNGSYYVSKNMPYSTTSSKYSTTIPRQSAGAVVTYYVQAMDAAGNYGYWPTIPEQSGIGWYVVQGGYHIVLSEIAYNPRGNDPGHEYIELYNPFPAAVSLEGWWLEKQRGSDNSTNSVSPFPASSMIPAYGYFLVGGDDLIDLIGLDAPMDFDFDLPNSAPGMGIKLFNQGSQIIDRVAYIFDATDIPILDQTLWESYPYIPILPDDGSFERKPAGNSLSGNYMDTDNNSADFEYKYFEEPQGSWCLLEYPPWTANVTSPYLLPDDHPKYLVATRSSDTRASEPSAEQADDAAFVGPLEPELTVSFDVEKHPSPAILTQAITAPARAIPRRQEY